MVMAVVIYPGENVEENGSDVQPQFFFQFFFHSIFLPSGRGET
jgi:hypothetical protein